MQLFIIKNTSQAIREIFIKTSVFFFIILFLGKSLANDQGIARNLTEDAVELAYCTNVLAYGISWFLLNNNEGASKFMVFNYARSATAFFMMHYENGRISGSIIAQFKEVGSKVKPYLDNNTEKIPPSINECILVANLNSEVQLHRNIKIWGKDWNEAVDFFSDKIRKDLGL